MTNTDQYSKIDPPKIKVRLPFGAGVVHFVGIGGIGMSGIAEVLHNAMGYRRAAAPIFPKTPTCCACAISGIPRHRRPRSGENIYDEDGAPVAAVVRLHRR